MSYDGCYHNCVTVNDYSFLVVVTTNQTLISYVYIYFTSSIVKQQYYCYAYSNVAFHYFICPCLLCLYSNSSLVSGQINYLSKLTNCECDCLTTILNYDHRITLHWYWRLVKLQMNVRMKLVCCHYCQILTSLLMQYYLSSIIWLKLFNLTYRVYGCCCTERYSLCLIIDISIIITVTHSLYCNVIFFTPV